MNIKNLEKMFNLILTIPASRIDMSLYRSDEDELLEPECKSLGCLVGHATVLDRENVLKNYIDEENSSIHFSEWSHDFFETREDPALWAFMFGCDWANTSMPVEQRHPQILARIRFVISGGFDQQFRDWWWFSAFPYDFMLDESCKEFFSLKPYPEV